MRLSIASRLILNREEPSARPTSRFRQSSFIVLPRCSALLGGIFRIPDRKGQAELDHITSQSL